jgi:DNA mismatch endonuclease, patch repair protein
MPDKFAKGVRSRIMARVRARGNASTELRAMRLLRANKINGWRRHFPILGKPDFAFPRAKVAVFVDGCFWHGCARCYRAPKSSRQYWQAKVKRNMKRDAYVVRVLKKSGWKVMRIKECQLGSPLRLLTRLKTCVGESPLDKRKALLVAKNAAMDM